MRIVKPVFCLFLCTMLLFLFACEEQGQIKQYCSNDSPMGNCVDTSGREQSNRFLGTLPSCEESAPTVSYAQNGNECTYEGVVYREMVSEEDPGHFCWSGWQLDCDYLEVLGKTEENEILYGIKDKNKRVLSLLILNSSSDVPCVSWFVLPDLADTDMADYSLDDFDIQKIVGEEDSINAAEQLWFYHTSAEYEKTLDPLIEWPEMHCLFLVNKEAPWLVYELNYCYRNSNSTDLFIYCIPSGGWVMLDRNGDVVPWLT